MKIKALKSLSWEVVNVSMGRIPCKKIENMMRDYESKGDQACRMMEIVALYLNLNLIQGENMLRNTEKLTI